MSFKSVARAIGERVRERDVSASLSPRAERRLVRLALVALLLLVTCVGPAAAVDQDFLCQQDDYDGDGDQEYKQFVLTLQNLVGTLMVMGPVCGIVVFLFASVARAAQTNPGGGETNYDKARRDALVYGFSVPVAAYGMEVLSMAILQFDITCIVP